MISNFTLKFIEISLAYPPPQDKGDAVDPPVLDFGNNHLEIKLGQVVSLSDGDSHSSYYGMGSSSYGWGGGGKGEIYETKISARHLR